MDILDDFISAVDSMLDSKREKDILPAGFF